MAAVLKQRGFFMTLIIRLLAISVIAMSLLTPIHAWAQASRTWVSGVGDDANPCSRTAPCKTFAGAISKTAAGGEIDVLDPGGFGAVTITKSITIDGGGTFGSVLASGTNGIIINAGVNDKVILRNLSINGTGSGLNGIELLNGKVLIVDHCNIIGFVTSGILVQPTTAAVQATISNSTIYNNGVGINFSSANSTGGAGGLITNTVIANNSGAGVSVTVPAGKPAIGMIVDHITADFNGSGLVVDGNGNVLLNNSTIVANTGAGVSQINGGVVNSFKTNVINDNSPNGTPLTVTGLN